MMLTCAPCKHSKIREVMGLSVAYCKLTKLVVPQHSEPHQIRFLRVPLQCPLPDSEAMKRAEPQPDGKTELRVP